MPHHSRKTDPTTFKPRNSTPEPSMAPASRRPQDYSEEEDNDYSEGEYEDGVEQDGFFGDEDDPDEDPDYSGSDAGLQDYPDDTALDDHPPTSDEDEEEDEEEDLSMDLFNQDMEDFHHDLKAAQGFRKGRMQRDGNRGGGRRAVGEENYSFEVRSLLGQANQAYAFQKLDEALKVVKQIIQIEPGVYAAWKILGEIFAEKGDKNKCLLAWLTAAHARPKDWELWLMCAKMSLDQYGPDKQSYRDQAIYCYNRAIRANPDNIDAIYDRSLLLKDAGHTSKAAEGFVMLNRLLPNDMTVLKELAGLYIDLGKIPEAIEFYNRSVEFFKSTGNPDMGFGWSELNIFAELYCMEKEWAKAIQTIKSLGRWLYGRASETYWDQINGDDREWDEDDRPRRCLVREFEPGRFSKESYTLPLELRVKLGLCRLRMGNKDEALSHFRHLQDSNTLAYNDLFQEVGDALFENSAYEDAITYYSVVVEAAEYLDRKLWFNMAECYRGLDNIEDAEDAYMTVLEAYPTDEAAMMQLAGIYEVTNRKPEALDLVNEIIRIRREKDATEKARREAVAGGVEPTEQQQGEGGEAMAFFPNQPVRERARKKKPGMLSETERAEMDAKKTEQTTVKYRKLEMLGPAVEQGDQAAVKEWLDTAGDLVDDFRNTRALYPQDRNLKFKGFMTTAQRRAVAQGQVKQIEKMQSRLQESLTFQDEIIEQPEHLTKFRGLDFDTWLRIFMQYAIYLAKYDNFQDAYDVCNAAKEANVFFQDKQCTFTIWITWLACAIMVGDSESCSTICRWFMTSFQFTTETYSLFTASITASKNGLEVFHNNANQKYLLRQIKAMDQAITGKTRVGAATLTAVDDNGEKYVPTDVDVGLLMLYGHILASGRSYISALNYYTRAFSVLPNNPMITFCIGLAYLHRSMQRQSENRHMQALQGMTFLFEYFDLRTGKKREDGKEKDAVGEEGGESMEGIEEQEEEIRWDERQEAEYNIGRAFHHIGLTHLAIPYYERVLQISDEQTKAGQPLEGDLKWEAAYNLQMVYVTSGNPGLAKIITDKYLVL